VDLIKDARVIALKTTHSAARRDENSELKATVIEIMTENGYRGFGEVQSGADVPSIVAEMLTVIKPKIIDKNPADYRLFLSETTRSIYVWGRRGLPVGIMGAIEIAVIDAYAQQLRVPFYQILGGAVKDKLRVYASGGENQTPSEIEKELSTYADQGYTAVKIRIGGDPAGDVAFVALVRSIVGDQMDIIVDAGQQYKMKPWPLPVALEVVKAIEKYSPFWIEDPYNINDQVGWQTLHRMCKTNISGGESMTTFWEAAQLVEHGLIDILQPDVCVLGGPSEYLKLAHFAAGRGIPIANHTWGTGISLMANIHLQCVIENSFLGEMPCLPHPIREAVIQNNIVCGGYVKLPQAKGLGAEISTEVEKEFGYSF
jgi:L-alanine-DL-glutamate epimerase-like enolase superfamily enzyme